jgi:nucleoid DNA-binding protein
MTRTQLVEQLAEKMGRPKTEADTLLEAVLGTIGDALVAGEPVELRGFGRFQVNQRKERQGRNLHTGETITIPAKKAVAFKPGKELTGKVNASAPAGQTTSA